MSVYTIRPEFSIQLGQIIFSGGEEVDLTDAEFELHKHKLEGVEATVIPIFNSEPDLADECCFPQPNVKSISLARLRLDAAKTIEITGSFFTPEMSVSTEGFTVDFLSFVSSHLIRIDVTGGNKTGFFDLTLDNGKQTILEQAIEIIPNSPPIVVDLRTGGANFNISAIKHRSEMTYSRSNQGVIFNGLNPWASWAKFTGDNNEWTWDRSTKKKLTWIFRNGNSFMLGIGSNETNENSSAQYHEGEILGYFSSETGFYGFFGNDGTPGEGASQNISATTSGNAIKKLVLENNGEPGANFYLYEIPSFNVADWTDESVLVSSGVIDSQMSADATTLMPFCIPRSSNFNVYIGFILEDM